MRGSRPFCHTRHFLVRDLSAARDGTTDRLVLVRSYWQGAVHLSRRCGRVDAAASNSLWCARQRRVMLCSVSVNE